MATTDDGPPPELSGTGRAPKPWDKLKRRPRNSASSVAASPTVSTQIAKNTNALRELNVSPTEPGGESGEGGGGGGPRGGMVVDVGRVGVDGGASRGVGVVKPAGRVTSARAGGVGGVRAASTLSASARSEPVVHVNTKQPHVTSPSSSSSSASAAPTATAGSVGVKVTGNKVSAGAKTAATTRKGPVKKMVIGNPAAADDTRKQQKQKDNSSTDGGGVSSGPNFDWLLQRQLEVEMSLRGSLLNSQDDIVNIRRTFAKFATFFRELHDAAKKLTDVNGIKCAPAVLFQELLHRMAGVNAGVSMDEQRREGDVPMHQAKVLDRRHRTADECVEMDSVLGEDTVTWLVECVREMRLILRVKMEDANDVLMAEEAVNGAHAFFTRLQSHAEAHEGTDDFAVLEILRAV